MSDSVHNVIKTPVVTEKSMDLMGDRKYTFLVAPHANKIEIRNAIEFKRCYGNLQRFFLEKIISVISINLF